MGKVFKALSKSENEQPQQSLAALVVAEEEARDAAEEQAPADVPRRRLHRPNIEAVRTDNRSADAFDFMHFSLNAPATDAFDREASVAPAPRSASARPASEVTLDATRVDPHLVAFYDFDPRAAEEYNKTAITMISAAADQPLRRVLIASAQHGEGRTCVALNLACALAQAKQRVLVIDTDLQRPSLHRLLGIEAERGVAEVVTNNLAASAATIKVLPYGFHVLPLRERVENSAEILASPALREMLDDCEAQYDFMLFDSSPLLDSKDANLLMKLTHATVMVVRPGKTNAGHLSRAIAPLPEDNVFGVVLNRAS
ncbi:MAG TPA: CpsD/CapB family tyrosine-protein kinase [Blastocatellia bacterium]|nr:CpsD/CapB family tyrosine-protein kinase [Blastocatellia bacterium]